MTTYRAIGDTEVAVDAPLTQQLVQSLRDNISAIAEGDATSSGVRIALAALQSHETTPAAGDYVIGEASAGEMAGINNPVEAYDINVDFIIRVAGTYRLKLHYIVDRSATSYFKIQKSTNNGSSYSTLQNATVTSDSKGILSDDEACGAGDRIRFLVDHNHASNSDSLMRAYICVNDANSIYGVQAVRLYNSTNY